MKSRSYLTLPLVVLAAFSLLACGGSGSNNNPSPNPNPNPNPNPPLAEGGGYVSDLGNSSPIVANPANALWSFVLDSGEVWAAYGNTDASGKTTWGGMINGMGMLDTTAGTIDLPYYLIHYENNGGIYTAPKAGNYSFTVSKEPVTLIGGDLVLFESPDNPDTDVTYPIIARGPSNYDPTAVADITQVQRKFRFEDGLVGASFDLDFAKPSSTGEVVGLYVSNVADLDSCAIYGSLTPKAGKNYFTVTFHYATQSGKVDCRYKSRTIDGIALLYNDAGSDRLLIMAKDGNTAQGRLGKVFFGVAE